MPGSSDFKDPESIEHKGTGKCRGEDCSRRDLVRVVVLRREVMAETVQTLREKLPVKAPCKTAPRPGTALHFESSDFKDPGPDESTEHKSNIRRVEDAE